MSALIDAGGCRTQMSGWWALMSSCDNDLCRLKDHWRVVIRYGMRGQRKNPGPGSQRRRTQRLCVLQRAMDSDSESDAESAQGCSFPGVEVVHVDASLPVSIPMERGCRVGEASHPHGAHVRNVCPRLGTQPTMVDSDDDRPLLRLIPPVQDAVHPPGPELFVSADSACATNQQGLVSSRVRGFHTGGIDRSGTQD